MELQRNTHHVYCLWTKSYFVKSIGNADEKTIWKYVQNQLIELDRKEEPAKRWELFKTR
ncbi:MAG TPA: hypothetical protein ENG90_08180 [Gammaproteobacteria bacterium]|nr:hypothetical protein [Gammaproteobacteria bacterium]HDZ78571.1 hypothetical protein [Gammaproteobacteria bacterium]